MCWDQPRQVLFLLQLLFINPLSLQLDTEVPLLLPLVQFFVVEDEAVEWRNKTDVGEHEECQAHADHDDASIQVKWGWGGYQTAKTRIDVVSQSVKYKKKLRVLIRILIQNQS